MDTLPIVIVGVVALAALALDDVPDYQRAPLPGQRSGVLPVKAVPLDQSLSPNEALVAAEPVEAPAEAPKRKAASAGKKPPTAEAPKPDVVVRKAEVPRSRLDVQGRRLAPDERLQRAVMSAITGEPNLSGQIAVEARDAVVRLSGWTTTPGQSLRAEKTAARVDGVRRVVNEIRPRMGVITF